MSKQKLIEWLAVTGTSLAADTLASKHDRALFAKAMNLVGWQPWST